MNVDVQVLRGKSGRVVAWIVALLIAMPVATSLAADATPTKKPNILVVVADQWRAQAFGFAGDKNAKTPNFDKLASQSVNFVNAVSTIPVCSPMRATFLTGQHALTHGVFMNDVSLNPDAVTIAKVAKQAGYDTGCIGKWHIDGHGRSAFIPKERRQGFDYWKVLECTHDYNKSFYYADGPEKLQWEGYDAEAQTSDAISYIQSHKTEKPFLLCLMWGPPHDPYAQAPAKYQAMFPPDKLEPLPNVPKQIVDKWRKNAVGYYAHGAALDDCIGRLMASLKDKGIDDNTLVVFTADHGDLLGSHAAYNKQQPYDEDARVPMLFRLPGKLDPRQVKGTIATEDLMPTILGISGVPIPSSVEGYNFTDYLLHGGQDPSGGAAVIMCPAPFGQWNRLVGGKAFRAVRTEQYTYVRDASGPWLLFDNHADPYQMNNLVQKPEAASVQKQLDATLQAKLKERKDEFLKPDDYIAKWGYKVSANGTVPYEK